MKIKIITSLAHGACSYYRSLGVFSKIKGLEIDYSDGFDWHVLNGVDMVFFERPHIENHFLAIKYAKDYNLKVWVDYDDLLLNLPEWNNLYSYFNEKLYQDIIKKCLEYADIVTVPTKKLQEELSVYNKNIIIIPNAHNDYNYPLKYSPSGNENIMWRGSTTHRGDILYYLQELVEIAKNNKTWRWEFIGKDIWYITDVIENKKLHPELNLIQYFTRIKNINPGIYIVPLYPCAFNESKSSCGWLEATYCGAVTLAPEIAEWIKPGIINYSSKQEFKDKLQMLIDDPDKRKANHKASFEYMKKNLVLSVVNKQREKILNTI
jgi:hypothetical protein